jgi:aspartate/methionine/tyrosine aminotransferase
LISINFPNNPTGAIPSQEIFRALVDLCQTNGIWLFSDEVYRLIERSQSQRLPQAVDAYERAVSLNVMSKAYGLPGLRIGWLAAKDAAFLLACEHYKHFPSICNSGPSEVLAEIAVKARGRILERNRDLVRNNISKLDRFFAEFPELFEGAHLMAAVLPLSGTRVETALKHLLHASLKRQAFYCSLPASIIPISGRCRGTVSASALVATTWMKD